MVEAHAVPRWLRLLPLALGAAAILCLATAVVAHDPDASAAGESLGNPSGLAGIAFRGPVGTQIETTVCPPIPDALAPQYDDDGTTHIGHINGISDPAGSLDNYIDVGSVDTWHFYNTQYNNPSGVEGPHDVTNTALSVMMGTDGFFRGRLHLPITDGPGTDLVVYDVHTKRTYCIYGSLGHDGPYFFIDSTLNDPTVSSKTNVDMAVFYEPLFAAYYPDQPIVMDHIFLVTSAFEDVEPTIPQPPKGYITLLSLGTTCEDSSVKLTAAGSFDPDGTVVSYAWDLGDATSASTIEVTHTYSEPGPHTATLTVTDNSAMKTTVAFEVQDVGSPSCCPDLLPLYDIWMEEGQLARFTAGAIDPEGDPLIFRADPRPAGSTFSADGTFSWQTAGGDLGNHRLAIYVTDGWCEVGQEIAIHVTRSSPDGPAPDADLDGIADSSDNCPTDPNHEQDDGDRNGQGDACDAQLAAITPTGHNPSEPPPEPDADMDGVPDARDNCPTHPNPQQENVDRDADGDPCDVDADGDGVANKHEAGSFLDNCPMTPNADQKDANGDGVGDKCESVGASVPGDSSVGAADGFMSRAVDSFSPEWLMGSIVLAGIGSTILVVLVLRRRD